MNMFEILNTKYDTLKEVNKIAYLYNNIIIKEVGYSFNNEYSVEKLFETKVLPHWKQRRSYLTCQEIKNDLEIATTSLGEIPNNIIILLEYYENIMFFIYAKIFRNDSFIFPNDFTLMFQNLDILIENLNYEIKLFGEEEKIILLPKKPEAIAVAEISSEETALAILMYNHHSMKGNITGKRKLLYQISLEFETLLKQPHKNYNDFFEKTNGLLNNLHIRHDNKTKEGNKNNIINIGDKELENLYDEVYQLLLFCVLIRENLDRKKRVSEFLESIKENQCKD
ncbi:uncharacterized protein BN763_01249 [Clostridium sp. CAG:715]|nr:uncharacterized protein BN763_01249 [Clostridium sp. CAG:715]